MTRGEKIRHMNDEELAEMLYDSKDCSFCIHQGFECHDEMCWDGVMQWVREKIEE